MRRSGSPRIPNCRKLKRYGTLGLASDPSLEEGLSRLRLSGWLRVLFSRKVYAVCIFRVHLGSYL